MTPKKLYLLGAILIGVIILGLYVSRQSSPQASLRLPLDSLSNEDFNRIVIQSNTETTDLVRADGLWQVKAPFSDWAEGSAVDTLVSTLRGLTVASLISTNKANHAKFEVEDLKSRRIQIFSKDPQKPFLDFYMGKQGTGYGSSYLRYFGSDSVYLAENLPGWMFLQPADSFRKRSLFRTPLDLVMALKFEGSSFSASLTRSSTSWTMEGSTTPLAESQSQSLMARLDTLRISGFMDSSGSIKPNFEKPYLKLTAESNHGETILTVGSKKVSKKGESGPEQRWAQISGRPGLLLLDSKAVEDFSGFILGLKKPSS